VATAEQPFVSTGLATAGQPFTIVLNARAGAGSADGLVGLAFAFVDPIIEIADQLDPSTGVNYRDEYTLIFSDGVIQSVGSAEVPELPSMSLVMFGLAGILVLRVALGASRRDARHRPNQQRGLVEIG
jgi:hypothetical protein